MKHLCADVLVSVFHGFVSCFHDSESGVFEGKLFATQTLSQTEKNVSEPRTDIETATF